MKLTAPVRRGAAWLAAGLVLVACDTTGFADPDSSPSATPEPATEASEGAFRDDFDDAGSGWPDGSEADGGKASYESGSYEMVVGSWDVRLAPAPVTFAGNRGVIVRVDAHRLDDHPGRVGGIWGVVCGPDLEDTWFYEAVVQVSNGKGYPGLFRFQGDDDLEVFRKANRPHEAVHVDDINTLELQCTPSGNNAVEVVFTINGVEVARGMDRAQGPASEWGAALYMDGSPLPEGHETTVRFDDFEAAPAAP